MVLENLEVLHKSFGKGTVVLVDGKYFTVQFDNVQKTFIYPDIFDTFITLADGTVSDEIKADVERAKAQKQKERDKENQENISAMTRGIVIPGKENVNGDGDDDEDGRYKNNDQEEI